MFTRYGIFILTTITISYYFEREKRVWVVENEKKERVRNGIQEKIENEW